MGMGVLSYDLKVGSLEIIVECRALECRPSLHQAP
jgi:hypothetical protein